MTIGQWLLAARERLSRSGSPDPKPDAEWTLCHVLSDDRARLRLRWDEDLPEEALSACSECLSRREAGEPLQYILGEAWFYARRFACDNRALIPRQDTETLCEAALESVPKGERLDVLDLCTGSGVLAITIALERPLSRVTGADISERALSLAAENAVALSADVELLAGDLFLPVCGRRFHRIVCNPPYLTAMDMRSLQREVRLEPENALFGGEDGLAFYRRVARDAPSHLLEGGELFLEIGRDQAEAVRDLLAERSAFSDIAVIRDLNGWDRVIRAHKW